MRDETLTRRGFRRSYHGWIRTEVLTLLLRGAACGCAATVGVCRELLAVEPALHMFAAVAEWWERRGGQLTPGPVNC